MNKVLQHELRKNLQCGKDFYKKGQKIDAIKVNEETYKVFLRNGWWAVDKSFFE